MVPPRESMIDESVVRALLADQFPKLAVLDVCTFAHGWDNDLYRLGSDHVLRFPRREAAVANLVAEQRWLPHIRSTLFGRTLGGVDGPLRMTELVGVGRPGHGYPWPWSIMAWLPGDELAAVAYDHATSGPDGVDGYRRALRDPASAARVLGDFVAALHQPAPPDAPRSPYRGIAVGERARLTARHLDELRQMGEVAGQWHVDLDAVAARWQVLANVADWDGPALWLHGDLHPRNLVVNDGVLVGVVDFGDVCAGDPATDLSVAWMLFDDRDRATFRHRVGEVSDRTWQRAQMWAISLALAHLAGAPEDPVHGFLASTTLRRALG